MKLEADHYNASLQIDLWVQNSLACVQLGADVVKIDEGFLGQVLQKFL